MHPLKRSAWKENCKNKIPPTVMAGGIFTKLFPTTKHLPWYLQGGIVYR